MKRQRRPNPEAVLQRFSQAVREQRERLKDRPSQEAVAHEAGISLRHYQNLEAGRLNPSLLTALAVARALETTLGDLLDE